MRPGQLVTIVKDGTNYALLFLHLSSGTDPRGMGLRDDMLERAFEFRITLDRASGGPGKARYLFLGDFNTMGMKYPFDRSILAEVELKKWDNYAARPTISMRRLPKSHDATFFNGSTSSVPPSNLDNVYASKNLGFKTFFHAINGTPVEVDVRGWVNDPTAAKKDEWILLRRHHLHPEHRLVGPPGVLAALELLQGEDFAARVWEQDLLPGADRRLPARVARPARPLGRDRVDGVRAGRGRPRSLGTRGGRAARERRLAARERPSGLRSIPP